MALNAPLKTPWLSPRLVERSRSQLAPPRLVKPRVELPLLYGSCRKVKSSDLFTFGGRVLAPFQTNGDPCGHNWC